MMLIFVLANMIITLSYLMLGLYVAPRFDVIGAPIGVHITKWAMLAFFFFCALTHTEQSLHVISEPSENVAWMLSWHMVLTHLAQAIAAPIAAALTTRYLVVRLTALPQSNPNPKDPQ